MSKVNFKYKKTLKHADFVHADLDYHEDLAEVATLEFKKEVGRVFDLLPQEAKDSVNAAPVARPPPSPQKEFDPIEKEEDGEQGIEPVGVPEEKVQEETADKSEELKRLFRKIASKTHPDKLAAQGYSTAQIAQRTKMFKKAKEAYSEINWYELYKIAIELDLTLPPITDEFIGWLEEDIQSIQKKIAHLLNLTAVHWYLGDDTQKKGAIKHYFFHT